MLNQKIRPLSLQIISFCALVVMLAAVYRYRVAVGWFVWENSHIIAIATALNPKDAGLRFAIGNYYFGEGAYDTKKAGEYFRAALSLDPDLEGSHYQLARIYFIGASFSKALEEINKEMTLHPDFKRSHYVRGLIYGYSGKLAEAEADFAEFLKWKPDSWAGHNDLAWVYFQEGKYAKTRDTARKGLAIAPNNPWLLNSLGVALLNTGDKKGAAESFEKALALVGSMSERDWGVAYPGNDPLIYGAGLSQMKESIRANLELLDEVDI